MADEELGAVGDTETSATPAPTAPAPAAGADAHSAAASILGYAYQMKSGLLELLRCRTSRPGMLLSIEMYDDIAWEDSKGEVAALLQYKLHQNREGHLGNSSPDLWGTIKVWLDRPHPADPHGPELWMVTTAVASPNSIAALLRADDDRDVPQAVYLLEKAADGSRNTDTQAARDKFLELTPDERTVFVDRIQIADGSGDLAAVEAEVADLLATAAPWDQVDAYLGRVWAWWNGECISYLEGRRPPIGVQEMHMALSDIRDDFREGNLPRLVERAEVEAAKVLVEHADRLYVRQLRELDLGDGPLARAVHDYQSAFLQAHRWLENQMVNHAQLDDFAADLRDEWEREFDFMCDNLPSGASDDDKKVAGRRLLHELERSTEVTMPGFTRPFFARGQRHELADQEQLCWHPDFKQHLKDMLLGA